MKKYDDAYSKVREECFFKNNAVKMKKDVSALVILSVVCVPAAAIVPPSGPGSIPKSSLATSLVALFALRLLLLRLFGRRSFPSRTDAPDRGLIWRGCRLRQLVGGRGLLLLLLFCSC